MAAPNLPVRNLTSTPAEHLADHGAVNAIVTKFDTTIGGAASGQVLTWNGSVYVPATPGGGTSGTWSTLTGKPAVIAAGATQSEARTAIGVTATAGTVVSQPQYMPEDNYLAGEVVGSSADGEAIARAIDNAPAGAQIHLRPGKTYISTRTIVIWNGKTLVGNGATIRGGNTATGVLMKMQDTGSTMRDVNVVAGVGVAIAVAWAGGTQNASIFGGSISGLDADGVDQGVGINSTGIDHVLIQNVRFRHCVFGVLTNELATDLRNVQIIGCNFDDISGDPIELNHPGSANLGLRCAIIANNFIHARATSDNSGAPGPTSAGFGVGVAHCRGVSITGNTFYDCRQKGIHIEDTASDISITGNIFEKCAENIWTIGCDTVTIQGNSMFGGNYGVHATFDPTHRCQRFNITGNTFRDMLIAGVLFESDQTPQSIISNNIFDGIVSGARGLRVSAPAGYFAEKNIYTRLSGTGIAETFDTGQPSTDRLLVL